MLTRHRAQKGLKDFPGALRAPDFLCSFLGRAPIHLTTPPPSGIAPGAPCRETPQGRVPRRPAGKSARTPTPPCGVGVRHTLAGKKLACPETLRFAWIVQPGGQTRFFFSPESWLGLFPAAFPTPRAAPEPPPVGVHWVLIAGSGPHLLTGEYVVFRREYYAFPLLGRFAKRDENPGRPSRKSGVRKGKPGARSAPGGIPWHSIGIPWNPARIPAGKGYP